MSAWLGHRVPGLDPVGFWDQLRVPDAHLVDLTGERVNYIRRLDGG